jgi:hypothetical protein
MPIIMSDLVIFWLLSCFTLQSVPAEYLCQQLFLVDYFFSNSPEMKANLLVNFQKPVEIALFCNKLPAVETCSRLKCANLIEHKQSFRKNGLLLKKCDNVKLVNHLSRKDLPSVEFPDSISCL